MLLSQPVCSGGFLLRLSRPKHGNMARKRLRITTAGNGCAALGTKTGEDEQKHSYTKGKACFLHFTHTQLLVQGQRRRSPKVYLLSRALKAWHAEELARFVPKWHLTITR